MVSSLQLQAAQKGTRCRPTYSWNLRVGTTHQPIPFDHDGRLTLPMRANLAAGDATVWINQLKGVVVIQIAFTARLPPSAVTSYGRPMESLPVMKRITKQ